MVCSNIRFFKKKNPEKLCVILQKQYVRDFPFHKYSFNSVKFIYNDIIAFRIYINFEVQM